MTTEKTDREKALLYDLFIVPGWREVFDRLLDEVISPPKKISVLDVGCGTGGYAVNLAGALGPDSRIAGLEASEEMLEIARGKAAILHMKHVSFENGTPTHTGQLDHQFNLVIADLTLSKPAQFEDAFRELARVTAPKGTVAVKLTTRGSFDEFFSLYWEALHEAGLDDLTPALESLITGRVTTDEAEAFAKNAGLQRVQSVTHRERFDYADAPAFFGAPLIEHFFLEDWMAILPDDKARQQVRGHLDKIIERERQGQDWDVSIKATLITGQK